MIKVNPKLFYIKYILILFLCFSFQNVNSQVLITEELFDNEPNGAITGKMSNGEPWEANKFGYCGDDNPGFWGVDNGRFRCNNVEGFNCCGCGPFGLGAKECGDNKNEINFGPIDISSFQGLSFDFEISDKGNLECSSIGGDDCPNGDPYDGCVGGGNDQVVFSYSVDGEPYKYFEYYCGSSFCFQRIPQSCGLNGKSLRIKIFMGTQKYTEYYYIEKIKIFGFPKSIATAKVNENILCEGDTLRLYEIGNDAIKWDWTGPNGFVSKDQNPVLQNVSVLNSGDYNVKITDKNGCPVIDKINVKVEKAPKISLESESVFCPNECFDIRFSEISGTFPLDLSFDFVLDNVTTEFNIQGNLLQDKLIICYSGNAPSHYNDIDKTLYIPIDKNGQGFLKIKSVVDKFGCTMIDFSQDKMNLFFKSKLEILENLKLEECDIDNTGNTIFNLSELEDTLINEQLGAKTIWCLDPKCNNIISTPESYLSSSSEVFVFLVDETNLKCESDTIPIVLNVLDKLNAGVDNEIMWCNDESTLDITSLLGIHDEGGEWKDIDNSGVDVVSSGGKEVSFKNMISGIYRFNYILDGNNKCPISSATITIQLEEVSFGDYSKAMCSGQIITIGANDYSTDNPNGTEILTNKKGCDSIVNITIKEKEISSSIFFDNEDCFGNGKFILEKVEGANLPVEIDIEGLGAYEASVFPFEIHGISSGEYVFSIVDIDGCESNIKDIFSIEPFSKFNIQTSITKDDGLYNINVVTDINHIQIDWIPDTGLSCSDCLNPKAFPKENTEYIVKLTDDQGCEVSDTIRLNAIEQKDIKVDIPNVFTPNGDGQNDYFYVKSEELDLSYSMYIFNRWGEQVFYADKLKFNNESLGWDGNFNGEKSSTGVFVYMIIIDYGTDKKDVRVGDVLLLK